MWLSPQPAQNLDTVASNGYAWFVASNPEGMVDLRLRSLQWQSGANPPILSSVTTVSTIAYDTPPNAPALGSTDAINVGSDRMQAAIIRNDQLWTARTIGVDGTGGSFGVDRTACEWFALDVTSAPSVTLNQTGRIYDSASSDRSASRAG